MLQHLTRATLAMAFAVSGWMVSAEPLQVGFAAPAAIDCGRGSFAATAEGADAVHGAWQPATVLHLDSTREWRVETTSERCWTPPARMRLGSEPAQIPVWPKRVLRGRLLLPKGENLPSSVELRVVSPPRAESPPVPESLIRCPVEEARFTCEVPAAPLDVRVAAEGFAPHYLWDVVGGDVGELRLTHGAAVTGRAAVAGEEPPAGITVELRPASFTWSPGDRQRIASQQRVAQTNARGFFAFRDVAPGEYVVKATKQGWSAAEYRVHVASGATEAALGNDLVLPELATLEVIITPPVDALQQPWMVKLARRVDGSSIPIAEGDAENGRWRRGGLDAGVYAVSVTDRNGATVSSEGITVTGGPVTMPVRIAQVMIRVTVTLAGEPVAARLRFNDGFGKIASFATGPEGRISGILASEGEWDIEVWPNGGSRKVTLHDVKVQRSESTGYADLHLELPRGRVHGTVVDAGGQPVQARVAVRQGRKPVAYGETAPDGSFDLTGVTPGEVSIQATTQTRQESEVITHRVHDDDDPPLRIVVRNRREFRGRLVTSDGRPVGGAQVHHLTSWRMWRELTSGPSGEFTLFASPADSHVTLAVVAHGLPFKFAAAPVATGSGPVDIVFSPVPGLLSVTWDAKRWPPPLIRGSGGEEYNIGLLINRPTEPESKPARFMAGGFQVLIEPGEYSVCSPSRAKCETVRIAAGSHVSVDAKGWE